MDKSLIVASVVAESSPTVTLPYRVNFPDRAAGDVLHFSISCKQEPKSVGWRNVTPYLRLKRVWSYLTGRAVTYNFVRTLT